MATWRLFGYTYGWALLAATKMTTVSINSQAFIVLERVSIMRHVYRGMEEKR